MSIPQQRYVNINSIVSGTSAVQQRELILRIFTTNELVPTTGSSPVSGLVEFTSLGDVGDYFGDTSEEFLRATFYFNFISKTGVKADKIGYYRWADVDTAPQIFGASQTQLLADFQAITDGSFSITLGVISEDITGLNFSSDTSLEDVALRVESAIQASNGDVLFTGSTTVFNALGSQFNFVGGATGANIISVTQAPSGTDILTLLGWNLNTTVISNGIATQTITEVLQSSLNNSNNFGSFLFIPTLTLVQVTEASIWNVAPNGENNQFIYTVPVLNANAQTWSDAVNDNTGTSFTLQGVAGEFPEMSPSIIEATTDYSKSNSVQNYMFQVFDLTPTVTSNSDADFFDNLKINYYGQTQSNGIIEFYQRGVLFGGSTNPSSLNVYANEASLKSSISTAILNALLANGKISANIDGESIIYSVITGVINDSLDSGIISSGKTLTVQQEASILSLTGNPNASIAVENSGFYLTVTANPSANTIDYLLVYSKDDVVRSVTGIHSLI